MLVTTIIYICTVYSVQCTSSESILCICLCLCLWLYAVQCPSPGVHPLPPIFGSVIMFTTQNCCLNQGETHKDKTFVVVRLDSGCRWCKLLENYPFHKTRTMLKFAPNYFIMSSSFPLLQYTLHSSVYIFHSMVVFYFIILLFQLDANRSAPTCYFFIKCTPFQSIRIFSFNLMNFNTFYDRKI